MFTVKETSDLAGVSIRTLHYYDKIGILSPSEKNSSGYRFYDQKTIERLRTILFFRELEFSLEEIKKILDDPGFSPEKAIEQQITLLKIKRERLDSIISLAEKIKNKEEINLDFTAFDDTKLKEYSNEAKEKWGKTPAFEEYEKKSIKRSEKENLFTAGEMMNIFARFGKILDLSPESPEAQALVKELQDFITANYYTCTDERLSGLGKMYSADIRFSENIDNSGGKGTAAFVSEAIDFYCKK